MQTIPFLLVLLSSLIHAIWNVLAKHVKGNTPVLVFAHIIGSFILFPFIFLHDDNPWQSLRGKDVSILVFGSVVAHAAYVVLLSAAYVHGDVGLVYPLARGSPILLTAIGLQIFRVDDPLSPLAITGVVVVIAGISLLCVEAVFNTKEAASPDCLSAPGATFNPLQTSEGFGFEEKSEEVGLDGSVELVAMRGRELGMNDEDPAPEAPPSAPAHTDRKRMLSSIALALAVGASSATYSTVDALGVQHVSPLLFLFLVDLSSNVALFPFLYKYHYAETVLALAHHKRTILMISPCVVGSYLIILLVFSLFNVSVALVVAVRTSSVLLGACIGVVFLGERHSVIKFCSIGAMCVGIVIIKFG